MLHKIINTNTKGKKRIMYFIISYDVASPKRLPKILKLCRKYLYWIQKSLFEGELTPLQLNNLKKGINKIINKNEDSVVIFEIRNTKVIKKYFMGIEKNSTSNFL